MSEKPRNYKYGLLPPTENRELALEQLRLAHQFREALVDVELARRAAREAALRQHCPGLAELEV